MGSGSGIRASFDWDWDSDQVTRATPITASYRNTQNVHRFFESECGGRFKLNRSFMAWLKDGTEKTMRDAADELLRRRTAKAQRRASDTASTTRELEQQAEIARLGRELAEARRQLTEANSAAALNETRRVATLQEHGAAIDAGRAELASSEAENARLEAAAAERLSEVQEMQATLLQSQKMDAIGQLTGGIAHDFNNMLTGISGSLELLQIRLAQGRLNELDRYITAAQGAAKRAATLTHRLLAFSRRQTLDPKASDLNQLVSGMEEMIRRTVGAHIMVDAITVVGLWPTLIDANQLENALLNLCINARDAMPDGGKLTIETANRWLDERGARERDVPPGQYVSLCVTDNGMGMSPEVTARAFDPFFTTKPMGEGTGLGLSMVYGFVRQSGGQVRIYSEVGKGTMVCLYLPRHYAADAVGVEPPTVQADMPQGEVGETVLVVDDEPSVRMLVSEVLAELGYSSFEAADGATALSMLQSKARIDLLITDVGLPNNLNGRQLADAARVVRPHLKVLFITGYAENAVVAHGHLDHDMHVMMKPFGLEALARRVKGLISQPGTPVPEPS